MNISPFIQCNQPAVNLRKRHDTNFVLQGGLLENNPNPQRTRLWRVNSKNFKWIKHGTCFGARLLDQNLCKGSRSVVGFHLHTPSSQRDNICNNIASNSSLMWTTDISNIKCFYVIQCDKVFTAQNCKLYSQIIFSCYKTGTLFNRWIWGALKSMPCGLRHGMAGTKFECSLDLLVFLLRPQQICGRSFCLKEPFCEDSTACQTCGPMDRTQGRCHYLKTPHDFWPICHLNFFVWKGELHNAEGSLKQLKDHAIVSKILILEASVQ